MKIYVFAEKNYLAQIGITEPEIRQTLKRVAEGTDTTDLVVSLYLLPCNNWFGGTAYVQAWNTPRKFFNTRGKWAIIKRFGLPADLPERFKLIRLLMDGNSVPYPQYQQDSYGWKYHYETFLDHLAILFAHELHHFRRFHLGLHPGEGEQSANRWALAHVKQLGFSVDGFLVKSGHRRKSRTKMRDKFIHRDPFKDFRTLSPGSYLRVIYDPKGRYQDEIVLAVRAIRLNSRRMVVKTKDGKLWHWPMAWLEVIKPE
ncbi:MAG: hypothetical protein ONB05_02835 [candidate division KSB1 bacterium]|nr:hypothetical protein [candidate division KSB1 bacterium]